MVGRALPWGMKLPRTSLDVTDPQSIKNACETEKPSGILCLSSIDIRLCEKNPLKAYEVNALAVHRLAQEAARRDIPCVLITTGAMFWGPVGSVFYEDSEPVPVNIYGQSKLLAEILLRQTTSKHLILRTGWLFGGQGTHHFNFFERALELAAKGEAIVASHDQEGSPTYLKDFIAQLENLLVSDNRGTFHVVNEGRATAADIAREIVGLTSSRSSVLCKSAGEIASIAIRRSPSEVLASKTIQLRPWQEALREYVSQ